MGDFVTNKKHFQIFTRQVKRYLKKFGLGEFEVNFIHDDLASYGPPLSESTAGVAISTTGRAATFYLNTDWGIDEPTPTQLERAAIHEVAHLLIGELTCYAHSRFISKEQIEVAEHSFCRRMENVFLNNKNGL